MTAGGTKGVFTDVGGVTQEDMVGKGDQRTKKGKRNRGSYGRTRGRHGRTRNKNSAK